MWVIFNFICLTIQRSYTLHIIIFNNALANIVKVSILELILIYLRPFNYCWTRLLVKLSKTFINLISSRSNNFWSFLYNSALMGKSMTSWSKGWSISTLCTLLSELSFIFDNWIIANSLLLKVISLFDILSLKILNW